MMNDLASYEALDGKKSRKATARAKKYTLAPISEPSLRATSAEPEEKIELPTQFLNGTTAFHTECIIRLMCRYQFQN